MANCAITVIRRIENKYPITIKVMVAKKEPYSFNWIVLSDFFLHSKTNLVTSTGLKVYKWLRSNAVIGIKYMNMVYLQLRPNLSFMNMH